MIWATSVTGVLQVGIAHRCPASTRTRLFRGSGTGGLSSMLYSHTLKLNKKYISFFFWGWPRLSYADRRSHNNYARPTRRVLNFHSHRSRHAKRIDEGLRAPFAKSESQWLQQPNRFDIPEVDAPKKSLQQEQDEWWKAERAKIKASRSPSHREFRANLNAHKFCGTGRWRIWLRKKTRKLRITIWLLSYRQNEETVWQ